MINRFRSRWLAKTRFEWSKDLKYCPANLQKTQKMLGLFRQTLKCSLVAWIKSKSLITIICGMTMKRYVHVSF